MLRWDVLGSSQNARTAGFVQFQGANHKPRFIASLPAQSVASCGETIMLVCRPYTRMIWESFCPIVFTNENCGCSRDLLQPQD